MCVDRCKKYLWDPDRQVPSSKWSGVLWPVGAAVQWLTCVAWRPPGTIAKQTCSYVGNHHQSYSLRSLLDTSGFLWPTLFIIDPCKWSCSDLKQSYKPLVGTLVMFAKDFVLHACLWAVSLGDVIFCWMGIVYSRYCTGGVRCELASAYIRSKGEDFKEVIQVNILKIIVLNFNYYVNM